MSESDTGVYLEPSPGIVSDDPEMARLAREITGGASGPEDRARLLFEWVRDNVAYNVFQPYWSIEDYQAPTVLARRKGYCASKACLLVTLARAAGIPARLGFADLMNRLLPPEMATLTGGGRIIYHCFTEWMPGGRWCKVTPAFDAALSQQKGWRVVDYRPGEDLLLPATDREGRPHIEYVRQHGVRAGFPLEEVLENWERGYGREWMDKYRWMIEMGVEIL